MSKTRILFVSANPEATGRLRLDEEVREIEARILTSTQRDYIEFIPKWAARPRDLLEHLNRYRPHVVHFSGHGSEAEEIILTNEAGETKPVSNSALLHLFTTLKDDIRVVVLNACFSEPQAKAITQQIDCAIGMSGSVGDRAAIVFASSFYSALGFGRSVRDAFDQGRLALVLENISEQHTPKLLTRLGVDAAGVQLLRPEGSPPRITQAATYTSSSVRRALVVEDDASIQGLLSSLLKREGFLVECASTAGSAISAVRASHFDIVLLDLELPDGSGFTVAETVSDPATAIIFLTQRSSSSDKIAGLGMGGDDYVTKPFDPEELLARIASVLRRIVPAKVAD